MSIDTSITSGTSQVLVLAVRDMEMRFRVSVLLSKTKVDDIDLVATLSNTHQEIVRLDVAVNEGLGMDVLDAGDELICKKQYCLQRELPIAKVEEVLQTRPKKIKHHSIIIALGAKPADKRDTDTSSE